MKEYIEIEVKSESGAVEKTYKIKRVKRSKLNDLIELQKDLLYPYIKNNASIGVIISNNAIWNSMEKLAAMLPIVGQEKPGFPLSEIEEDYTLMRELFFSQNKVENGVMVTDDVGFLPSLIADLHQLDYQGDWGKQLNRVMKEEEKSRKVAAEEQEKAEEKNETTVSES